MKWILKANSIFKYKKWTIVNGDTQFLEYDSANGTIVNVIAYDGISPYTPPANCTLVQVVDTLQVGDLG